MLPVNGRRKYTTEWTVGVTVTASILGRPQDLQAADVPETDPPCHLYIVSHRPRMSIRPESVTITRDSISGTLRLQDGAVFQELPFTTSHELGEGPWQWQAEWPFEDCAIVDTEGNAVFSSVVGLLHCFFEDWPEPALKHDVLYVGQAFGQAGERTAWDRLKRHETVQRILAETPPDKQVWLTLAAISDVSLLSEIIPYAAATTSDEEDDTHTEVVMDAFRDGAFKRKQAVALAEAGLIRYFQPRYNDRMKYTFPSRTQVPLESIRELDFYALTVELYGQLVGATYGSSVQVQREHHIAGFAIHRDSERQGMLDYDVLEPLPGVPN